MAEKSDEEIIKELGLETSDESSKEDPFDQLSLDDEHDDDILSPVEENTTLEEKAKNNTIENEDRDDQKEIKDNNMNNEEENLESVQKKQPKILKVLIAIAGFLFLILIIGAVLYFIGFFDPEPVKTVEKKIAKEEIKEEINFNTKDIDKKRLNKKLTMLTKHEIMNKEELELEENKIKEEEKKKLEAQEKARLEKKKKEDALVSAQLAKLEEEKKALENQQKIIKEEQEKFLQVQMQAKEELVQAQAELLEELNGKKSTSKKMSEETFTNNEEMSEYSQAMEEESLSNNSFLSFINVATIKGELYKSYLDKVEKYNKNLSLCRDNKNRIEIYFGPFDSVKERENVFNNLIENGFKEAYLIDFTNEEYKKRCKY